jgi:hypothetical protein
VKFDYHPTVRQTVSTRHIPSFETECERHARIEGAALRIAGVYSLSLRRAKTLVRHSSVRVRA